MGSLSASPPIKQMNAITRFNQLHNPVWRSCSYVKLGLLTIYALKNFGLSLEKKASFP